MPAGATIPSAVASAWRCRALVLAATVSFGLRSRTFRLLCRCLVWTVSSTTAILVATVAAILVVGAGLAAWATRVSTTAIATAARLLVVARLPTLRALRLRDATLGAGRNA
jgi:hypothetical protein